uniref:HTH psq-type domain-containing protein n=1 Tax=Strongyloides venezuelensis TaxID=75913 RepID=A0A0K0G521_STRVS
MMRKVPKPILTRSGRQRKETNDENALLVRESLNKNSQLSLRRRAKELCIQKITFSHIINQELYLFPYKMQVAQGIEAIDKVKRLEYVSKIKNLVDQN